MKKLAVLTLCGLLSSGVAYSQDWAIPQPPAKTSDGIRYISSLERISTLYAKLKDYHDENVLFRSENQDGNFVYKILSFDDGKKEINLISLVPMALKRQATYEIEYAKFKPHQPISNEDVLGFMFKYKLNTVTVINNETLVDVDGFVLKINGVKK